MTTHLTTLRRATRADVRHISQVLARAFFDDPTMRWCLPDDERRAAALPACFELYTTTFLPHDETYIDPEATGAALWLPPGHQAVADDDAEEFGQRIEQIVGVDAARVFEIVALLDEHHPHGSFYYLQFLGVEPRRQGQGVGSALLTGMLHRCDREGVAAYLVATSPQNKRLYERHGFEAAGELAPASGPPLWPMWRQPI